MFNQNSGPNIKKIFYWLPNKKEIQSLKTKDEFFARIRNLHQITDEDEKIMTLLGKKFFSDDLESKVNIEEYHQFINAFNNVPLSEKELFYPIISNFFNATNEEILDELLELIPNCDEYVKMIEARYIKLIEDCLTKKIESCRKKAQELELKDPDATNISITQKIKEINEIKTEREAAFKEFREKKYPTNKAETQRHPIFLTDYFHIIMFMKSKARQVPSNCREKILNKEKDIKLYNEIFGTNANVNREEIFEECLQEYDQEIEKCIKKKGPLIKEAYNQIVVHLKEVLPDDVNKTINFHESIEARTKAIQRSATKATKEAICWNHTPKFFKGKAHRHKSRTKSKS